MVEASLEEDKAVDVAEIDLTGKTDIADCMIVASGRSDRHVNAIAEHLIHNLKDGGYDNVATEGMRDCSWVVVDIGDVVVHIFKPEMRSYYNLERMWSVPVSDS